MGEMSSRVNLQGHVLEENHFHAACLVSKKKCCDAVSHPADLNLFIGAILFQCTDILMRVLQLISEKLPKHRIHGSLSLKEDGLLAC